MSSETNKDGTVILLDKSTVETLSETSLQADDFEHQSQPESTNTENKNFFKGWKKTIFVDDSSNIKVTFHVYLPSFEFVEGYPIVVGNIEELGNWENPIVKLKQQEGEYLHFKSNYWYSDPISIPLDRFNNYEVKYKYAFFIPKPRIEGKSKFSLFTKPKSDEKKKYNDDDPDEGDLYSEENEQLRLLEKKTGFKFDIAQVFVIKTRRTEFRSLRDFVFTSIILNSITSDNFKDKIMEYQGLMDNFRNPVLHETDIDFIRNYIHFRQESFGRFGLPNGFPIAQIIDTLEKFQSDLLPGEFYDALNITMTAAIRLNVINRSFDWLKLFKVASIIDPHFSFIEVIQDLKYSNDRMKNFLIEYTKSAKSIVNQIKNLSIYSNIGRWLFYNCNSFEILRFIWTDIIEHTTERDIQLIKYFCLRVEQLISSSHATSLNNYYRSGSYDSNDSNFIYEIYYYLSIIFPIVGKHAKIFKDLLDVAAGRAKNCALSNISNILTITPVISTLEKEIHDSYGEMVKELLKNYINKIDNNVIRYLLQVCGCKNEVLFIQNSLSENIVYHVMTYLEAKDKIIKNNTNLSTVILRLLENYRFWSLIFNATGLVDNLYSHPYVKQVQGLIFKFDAVIIREDITIRSLQEILEYDTEVLYPFLNLSAEKEKISEVLVKNLRKNYHGYILKIEQLRSFYDKFCPIEKVEDVQNFLNDINNRNNNLGNLTLKETLADNHWNFHKKNIVTARKAHKWAKSHTFYNVFNNKLELESYEYELVTVEYIAQTLMPAVFIEYDQLCQQYKEWESLKCSEGILIWKNVKDIEIELNLISDYIQTEKSPKLIKTLEYLSLVPTQIERLQQLSIVVVMFKITHTKDDWLERIQLVLRDDYLWLGKLVNFFEIFNQHFGLINDDCWDLIKELSKASDFIVFLYKIAEHDIKNLFNSVDESSDERLIQEDTVSSLIQVKQFLLPLLKSVERLSLKKFLIEISNITQQNAKLGSKVALCSSNNMALQNLYNSISNKEENTREKIRNAAKRGTYTFERDIKGDTCKVTLSYSTFTRGTTKPSYSLTDLHDLRERALLISKPSVSVDIATNHAPGLEVEQKVSKPIMDEFVIQVDMSQEIINLSSKLFQTGHFYYRKFKREIKGTENMQHTVIELKEHLKEWEAIVNEAQEEYYYLTFFPARHILSFLDYFSVESKTNDKANTEECKKLIRFVNSKAKLPPKDKITINLEGNKYDDTFGKIGTILQEIFTTVPKEERQVKNIKERVISDVVYPGKLFVAACTDKFLVPNIIMSLYVNHECHPLPWQILICTASTTMEELAIFIKRCFFANKNGYKGTLFCLANLELLDFELQYNLVNLIMSMCEYNDKFLLALICYREQELLHHILDQFSQDVHATNGLSGEAMKTLYLELCPNVMSISSELSGQGKTEYIRQYSFSKNLTPKTFLISDGIDFGTLVHRLKEFNLLPFESVHFNIISADRPGDVNLLLFELLTLGVVFCNMDIAFLPNTFIFIENNKDIKDEREISSFRFVEIFVNVFADQLVRLSLSSYFKVENLKLMVDEKNIRSTLVQTLLSVSKDFATKSIATKTAQKENISTPDNENAALGTIVQWDDSNHLLVFFLSQTPDSICALYRDKEKVPKNVKTLLQSQYIGDKKLWDLDDYRNMNSKDLLSTLENLARKTMHIIDYPQYALSADNLIKMALILLRARANIPVIVCGEAGCGKTSLIGFLSKVVEVKFRALNLHAGITEETILFFMGESLKEADKGEIWLFFDEINTCNHIGLLADLIAHRMLNGKPIHHNIRLFAACNPYRIRTKAATEAGLLKPKDSRFEEKSKLVYQVNPLPDQILDYVWDYGILKPVEEAKYIEIMVKELLKDLGHKVLSECLFFSQDFIRRTEESYSVSLRDVKRAIKLVKFFINSLKDRPPIKKYGKIIKYPVPSDITNNVRSYILALGLCYQSRLYEQQLRKEYRRRMSEIFKKHKFNITEERFDRIIREEQENYIDRMQCPPNTAKNEALLENVLVMIVCIFTKIPCFIIGAPGSSKSLAVRLINQNLRGVDSNDEYFRSLLQVYLIPHQGSSSSTSEGIHKVFEKAVNYQKTSSDEFPLLSVVLLDVVGLAETSPFNPLKVLHSLLEPSYPNTEPAVSCVAISNWRLDNSKSSIALLVQRPKFELNDLTETASRLLIKNENSPIKKASLQLLAQSYLIYEQRGQKLSNFHGLRDYYSLVKSLSQYNSLTPENIHLALTRNFGGIGNIEELVKDYFGLVIKNFNSSKEYDYKPIPIWDLINANLEDKDARHLMVIGKSDSIVNLLNYQLRKKGLDPVVILGSQFPEDQDDYSYSVLNRIMMCVETGRPLILTDLEIIYGSLYDLWNQNYIVVGSEEDPKFYARVALGAYSNPLLYVAPTFRCILVMDESKLEKADPPLLNRFEKQRMTMNDALMPQEQDLVETLKDWAESISTVKLRGFKQEDLFIGFDKNETLQSLVIDVKKSFPEADEGEVLIKCKEKLINIASSDGMIRAEQSNLHLEEVRYWKNVYFNNQHHNNLIDHIQYRLKNFVHEENTPIQEEIVNDEGLQIIINTFSNINTDVKTCLQNQISCQVDKLSTFKTESQFQNRIKYFWTESQDEMLILQCDVTTINAGCIKLAKFLIEQFRNEYFQKKRRQLQLSSSKHKDMQQLPIKHVCIILHIHRELLSSSSSFYFMCGWDKITIETLLPQERNLSTLLNESLSDLILSSTYPFEVILKQELLWCLLCIKYPSNIKSVEHIKMLNEKICENPILVNFLKTRTLEWLIENPNDTNWQYKIASNKKLLYPYSSFVNALLAHIRSVVRKPIAKWLYALEKYAVIHTIIFLYNKSLTTKGPAEFMMEGVEDYDETEKIIIDDDAYLLEFWNKMVDDKNIISIEELIGDPSPDSYKMPHGIYELEFPFSYYIMKKIDDSRRVYEEELSSLFNDADNVDKTTGKLYSYKIEEYNKKFIKNIGEIPIIKNSPIVNYPENYFKDFFNFILSNEVSSSSEVLEKDTQISPHVIKQFDTETDENKLLEIEFEKYLVEQVIRDLLNRINYLKEEEKKRCGDRLIIERWQYEVTKVISLCEKINATSELYSLRLLRICNDLLIAKSIPLDDMKQIIRYAQQNMISSDEVISKEFIDVVMTILIKLEPNEKNLIPRRLFILRCLDILALTSPVRQFLYQGLFTLQPFPLMGAIIIRIFKTEEKEHPNFILQLIRQPNQILGYSERLNIINRCFDINKLNTMMTTLTCDTFQQEFFSKLDLTTLVNCFNSAIGALYNNNIQPLQRIASIALLKEFAKKFWDLLIENKKDYIKPLTYKLCDVIDFDGASLVEQLNTTMKLVHPLINAFKLYLLRELRINKEFSTDDIKKFCEAQSNLNWFSNLDLDDKDECRLPFNPYWAISDYENVQNTFVLTCQSDIESLVFNAIAARDNVSRYSCKCGYKYLIGECGKAMATSKCPECKRVIGGSNFVSATGNIRIDSANRNAFESNDHKAPSQAVTALIQQHNKNYTNAVDYCMEHIKNDWEVLNRILNCSDEILALTFHSIIMALTNNPPTYNSKLDTPYDRDQWEINFTHIYVLPFTRNINESSAQFRAQIEQNMKKDDVKKSLLDEQINQTNSMDEKYCNEILPSLWRIICKIDFNSFRAYYISEPKNIRKYPFLNIFFKYFEYLPFIKYLYPMVKFIQMLNNKLGYKLLRDDAKKTTFRMFIESEGDKEAYYALCKSFNEFQVAYNFMINKVKRYQCHDLPLIKPQITDKFSIIYGLIEGKDEGIYLCAILEYLINIQNTFLGKIMSIPPESCDSLGFLQSPSWDDTTSTIDDSPYFIRTMSVDHAIEDNFIIYEWNDEILQYSQRNLGLGKGQDIIYDLQRIESELANILVQNKVYFEVGNEQLVLEPFPYHLELFSSSMRILGDIKSVIPQDSIPSDKLSLIIGQNAITSYMSLSTFSSTLASKNNNSSELLSLLEILLCFIKRTSVGNGELSLIEFINQWVQLSSLTEDSRFETILSFNLQLKHIVSLYEIIEEQVADIMIQFVDKKYKKALNEEMEEEIDNAIDYENGNKEKIPVDSFIIAMKRFIQRVLQIENDKENHRLYDYFTDMSLNLWNNNVIEEILDDKFPNTLLVANSFTAYEYIMQKKETFKPKQFYSSGMNTNSISIDTQMIAPSNATFTSPTQPTRTRNKGKKVIGKFDDM
ncbi:hypothetical protein GLOIN_2v1475340 [Rhizophagus irregularis DAOM 181602=DAOM 197198]|uniref:RZ-type domain-containing protein n=1 Tax=Rhizophagus irregularis (strain DAOM 181602 / DAOM 197198 / MUCL 43194) TaxID=747089 RepID=A0A2P4QDC3_RHIID|nr:hypothetical protein GLOIN_2v1475340 [Rhizophagus irregularis DAOM 181602=DAOM 197198]POG75640.1 hypothetical protein GLOIN_2v1475340 [Rhizophagus irregularis DAOM 181602=DAOM 197198]|eukprot:XP_025182506.1 hypothetical protein GLOIN_2v1475340 [Rhizophagus irregularis DAOM 181602=DAOM 197198]